MVANASDLLRLILTYCLGEGGLSSTTAWASAVGLADVSNVALLYRLRQCGEWLSVLVGQALSAAAPEAGRGRLIRIVDATTLPQQERLRSGATRSGASIVCLTCPASASAASS